MRMNELRKEGECIYINTPYAEAYIPTSLFTETESSVAYFYGDAIKVLGMFHMRFFKSEEDAEDRDKHELRTLKYPNTIETHPTSYHIETLTLNGIEEECYVLSYYLDDVLMESKSVQNVLHCEAYMDALLKAKLPKSIDYQAILLNWVKNFKTNGIHPGTKAVTLQIIISENARYAGDLSLPYRKFAATADTIKPDDYVMVDMNAITANNSVLSGIGFERVKEKIATSITMSKSGKKQNISPLEKVILY